MTTENLSPNGFPAVPPAGPAATAPATVTPPAPAPAPAPAAAPLPTDVDALLRLTQTLANQVVAKPEPAPTTADNVQDETSKALESIGDPVLSSLHGAALALAPGLDIDRALGIAIEAGNPSYIDRAYLKEIGKENADRLIQIAEAAVTQVNTVTQQRAQEIYSAAGGEAQWQASVAAFNSSATQAQKTLVSTMLESGRKDLIMGAAQMVSEFAKAGGFVPNVQGQVHPGQATGGGQALTKAEFQTALNKLDPYAPDYTQKRDALISQRRLGASLGR